MYLPYAMGAFQLLAGGSLVPALTGIAVGHLYYLLDQALPTTNGVRYLDPPAFLYATRGQPTFGRPLHQPDGCWYSPRDSPLRRLNYFPYTQATFGSFHGTTMQPQVATAAPRQGAPAATSSYPWRGGQRLGTE